MESIPFKTFKSKIQYFDDDIELLDLLRTAMIDGRLTDPTSDHVVVGLDPVAHFHLARRKNADGSRQLIINHLRTTLYSAYVKEVYAEVSAYLRDILARAAENGADAGRLIGDHNSKLEVRSILELGDWHSLASKLADDVFRSLENERSTPNLLTKMSSKLGLDVDRQKIEAALPFLEVRHLLVHNGGKPDSRFKQQYLGKYRTNNGKISLDMEFISEFRTAIRDLIEDFEQKVIAKGLLKDADMSGANAKA